MTGAPGPLRAAVTICLVPAARRGPFVFHDGVAAGCAAAAAHGFDAVEIFPADAGSFPSVELRESLVREGLSLAAVGTGAGWLRHRLHLCHADPEVRRRATEFIAGIVDVAADLGAPAIIGSMQGSADGEVTREVAFDHLAAALAELGEHAARRGQPLLYEPLNRYESNLFNRQAEAAAFLDAHGLDPVRILSDLFHMNIEEADPAAALVAIGGRLGHVHWADSDRRAMGLGHTDAAAIAAALRQIGYTGCVSAEIVPLPSPEAACAATLASLRGCGLARS
jgi:sugar phosphate isomerase/epimerase